MCPDIGDAGGIFNRKLRAMVDQLNSEFSADSSFIFVDSTSIITLNPAFRGIYIFLILIYSLLFFKFKIAHLKFILCFFVCFFQD